VYFTRTEKDLQGVMTAVFVGTVATVIFGLIAIKKFGIFVEGNVLTGVSLFRFSGLQGDPNDAAAVMCSALPLGVFLVRENRGKWRRTALVLGMLSLVLGIFSTLSRSAIFAFAIVTVAVLAREVRSRRGWAAVAGFLVVAALLTPGYYWERLAELGETARTNPKADYSLAIRLAALSTAWELFKENPLTGIGLGNFIERGATNVFRRIVVHNAYMEVLVSTGIFGLLAYLGIFYSGARHCWAVWKSTWGGALGYYVGLSLLSIMVSAVFLSMHFKHFLWFPLAMALALGNVRRLRRG
jgi:O-antigen ligase